MPATCPYPEPDQSSPCSPSSYFLKIHLIIILPSTPGSSKWTLSLWFPHRNPYCYFSTITMFHLPSKNVLSVSCCSTPTCSNDCLTEFAFPFVSNFKCFPIFFSPLLLYSLFFPISYILIHTQTFLSPLFRF